MQADKLLIELEAKAYDAIESKLFQQPTNDLLQKLRIARDLDSGEMAALLDYAFKRYWQFIYDQILTGTTDFLLDYYKNFTPQHWVDSFEVWLNDQSLAKDESQFDTTQDTTASAEFKENLQEQLLNAVTQDSSNRAQMVLDYFDNNLGPLVSEFGKDGTELVFEILTMLSNQEKERLGETSTPEVEEKITLDDLSFLDDDEGEEFRLVDLQEDADEFEI